MSEADALFAALRQSAAPDAAATIERLISEAPDQGLSKINALDLAAREKLDEERLIAALLNAARLGLFDMSWNVVCRSCAGVLDTNATLKTLDQPEYKCG